MGGGGISCDGTSLVPNNPRVDFLGLFFPPPAYTGIHRTLFLFWFRADALNWAWGISEAWVGFRVFWAPSHQQHFRSNPRQEEAWRAMAPRPTSTRALNSGFPNRCESAPAGAAQALCNSVGLQRSCKRWCEWLPGVVLGLGTLEKGGYSLSRPGWEF